MKPSPTATGIGNKPQRLGSSAGPSSPPLPTFHHLGDDVDEWEHSDIRGDIAVGWEGEGGEERRSNSIPNAAIGRAEDGGLVGSGGRGGEGVDSSLLGGGGWNLDVRALRPLPPFYPLDAWASRRIILVMEEEEDAAAEEGEAKREVGCKAATDEHHLRDISQRLSEACRHLSIQVDWDNLRPSATLFTMERVEMEISLYSEDSHAVAANAHSWARMMPAVSAVRKPPPAAATAATAREGVSSPPPSSNRVHLLVEVQRRKGCPITFHSYLRNLLNAAEGKFDPLVFHQTDGLAKPGGRDRSNAPRASLPLSRSDSKLGRSGGSGGGLARPTLRPPSFSADDAYAFTAAGLKTTDDSVTAVEGLKVSTSSGSPTSDPTDKALEALNIAASLIKKDRMDARRLGMESLVLLTDPIRAGIETARIASRVVLLGTAREELAFKPIDSEDEHADIDALFDESAGLGIRETLLEMIMGDDSNSSDDDMHCEEGIDKQFTDCLVHLCLSVLSNALEVLEGKHDVVSAEPPTHIVEDDGDGEGDRKPSPTNRQRAATDPAVRPSMDRRLSQKFIDDTNSTFGCDVLSSLIRIMGQAKQNPHDAYHSARCLGVLFKGCGNSHKARAQKDLNAKRIISAALDLGSRTHAKLYDASQAAMTALATDEESVEEEKTDREVQEMTNEGDDEMEEEATEQQQQSSLQYRPSTPDKDPPHDQY